MATFNKFNVFVKDMACGVHNLTSDATSTITIALCAAANAPVATNSVLADLTQIAYTNLSSRVVAISSSSQTSGTYKLVVTDPVLTASGGSVATFRYVVFYNDDPTSPADPLIGWYDAGTNITLASGESYTIDFTGTNELFSLV